MIAGNAVRTIPSAILKKIRRGSLGSLPHAKFHHYRCILIVGPSPQKSSKLEIFGYKFVPERRIALSDFFLQNLVKGRESQVRTLMPNLTVVVSEMWAYRPQKRQIGILK